jgi:hypothetical protein
MVSGPVKRWFPATPAVSVLAGCENEGIASPRRPDPFPPSDGGDVRIKRVGLWMLRFERPGPLVGFGQINTPFTGVLAARDLHVEQFLGDMSARHTPAWHTANDIAC